MSDNDLTEVAHEDNYDFDYYALSKLKRQERKKVLVLAGIIGGLSIILIVFIVLYVHCGSSIHGHGIYNSTLLKDVLAARKKAYLRIATYGEDCSKTFTCDDGNAFCRYLQGTYRCDCKHGYYGDGITCQNGYFAIHFSNPTTSNIPNVTGVNFPKSEGLSVCLWFALTMFPSEMFAFFTYASPTVKGEDDLMISLYSNKTFILTFQGKQYKLHTADKLELNFWNHICWTWKFNSSWSFYLNGKMKKIATSKDELRGAFPQSSGAVYLGQHFENGHIHNTAHMFRGGMTELFIYSRTIRREEVTAAYQNYAATNQTVVGWWKFRGLATSVDIKQIAYPFIHHYFATAKKAKPN